MPHFLLRPTALLFLLAELTTLGAQTPISGALSGTLTAGVYHATGNLSVAAGQTLVLDAGVIVKLTSAQQVTVDGTLVANGTALNPVIFTDLQDDSAGGDTNGNGPSTGNPASWRGIVFGSTANASVLHHTEARYGGSSFVANFSLGAGASPTFDQCTSRNNYSAGMTMTSTSRPVIGGCSFVNNGGTAVDGMSVNALAAFHANTASGNGQNYCHVTDGTLTASLSLDPSNHLAGAVVMDALLTIPVGATLTCAPGTVLKLFQAGDQVTVDGTLVVNGTAAQPVVFTGLADDSAGGDTNNNGPSSASPAAWRGIVFNASSSNCELHYTDVRYGGSSFVANFSLNNASPTLDHCICRNNYSHGMTLAGACAPAVHDCAFVNNGGYAVEGLALASVPNFANNTASGNAGNFAHVTNGSLAGDVHLAPAMLFGSVLVLDAVLTIPAASSLTIDPGVIVKFWQGGDQLTVDGTLVVNGTAAQPVVFTGLADDSAGGDTNNNGASSGTPASWRGIVFGASSSNCVLHHADVRCGGSSFVANFALTNASPTFDHCVCRNNYSHGMTLAGTCHPSVIGCAFVDNGDFAIEGVALDAVPGFVDNTASGNPGNYLRVTSATVATVVAIGTQSMLGGALVIANNVTVPAGGDLTLQQGVVLKFVAAYQVTVDGALHVEGTGYEPVVFTVFADDSFGGDTNNNGPSSGTAATWRGVFVNSGAAASSIAHCRIRYAGSSFVPGLTCASPLATLHAIEADHAYANGFTLSAAAGTPNDLVAWANGGDGIQLTGGSFGIAHATCTANNRGLRRETAWTGTVANSIARGNTTNFSNFAVGQVFASDGAFPGQNGNLDVDPLFVDAANGDLHLLPGSPCLGAADLLTAFLTVEDFDQNGRLLDHALVGAPLPDMGAFELPLWGMHVGGDSRLGSVLDYTVTGQAGVSFFLFGVLDGVLPTVPYGFFLAGGSPTLLAAAPTNSPFFLPVPPIPGLVGLQVGVQALTFPSSTTAVGNLTRLHQILVRP